MADALWTVVAALVTVILGGADYVALELLELNRDVAEVMRSWTRNEGGEG